MRHREIRGAETGGTPGDPCGIRIRVGDPGRGQESVRSRRSDPEGRSATSWFASEGGEDWRGGREKPGNISDLEDRDHRRDIDGISNLLVEVGADGAGITWMGTVVILRGWRRGVPASRSGLVEPLVERLMPGRIGPEDPQQQHHQGAHDSAERGTKRGTPTRHGSCFAYVQSVCIKGMRGRELNQNL